MSLIISLSSLDFGICNTSTSLTTLTAQRKRSIKLANSNDAQQAPRCHHVDDSFTCVLLVKLFASEPSETYQSPSPISIPHVIVFTVKYFISLRKPAGTFFCPFGQKDRPAQKLPFCKHRRRCLKRQPRDGMASALETTSPPSPSPPLKHNAGYTVYWTSPICLFQTRQLSSRHLPVVTRPYCCLHYLV